MSASSRHRNLALGAALVLALLGMAVLSLLWTPYGVRGVDIGQKLRPPSWLHWFGTDHLGRDIVSLILAGSQNSILVGVIAVGIGVVFGVTLGLLAAAKKGWLEEAIMRLADFTFAFPALLTAILLTSLLGPGIVNAIIAIGIFNIPVFARITRASANAVYARDFIAAARVAGRGGMAISIQHVLPNIAPALIVQVTIQFATAILAEAALSYLGLGTQPPDASWGRMLNEAQMLMFQAPRLAIYTGLAIALSVLGLNLLGDGCRDWLDPRLSRGR